MDDKSCEINQSRQVAPHQFPDPVLDLPAREGTQSAVLAGGCFWCTEAVFQEIEGVLGVTSGYAGGTPETADYQAVCSGRTGHAEAIEIHYDPSRVSYGQLLKVFFSVAHDPTQLNRQGADQGTQYRSAVFYHDDEEKRVAEAYIRQLNEARVYDKPIATTLEPLPAFYEAEAYHQDYAERNPMQPYILFTSAPKVAKLKKQYPERLKQLS
jgi:peptide-methionine (S)-S-oxide reductase